MELEVTRKHGDLGGGADVYDPNVGVLFFQGILKQRQNSVNEEEGSDEEEDEEGNVNEYLLDVSVVAGPFPQACILTRNTAQ